MTQNHSKKRGRPATGRGLVVSMRISPDEMAEIDEAATLNGMSRSAAIRGLVEAGLVELRKRAAAQREVDRVNPELSDHVKRAADRAEAMSEQKRRSAF